MSSITIAILGIGSLAFVVTCIVFTAARVRNTRRRQVRLSFAFDRAQELGRGAAYFSGQYPFANARGAFHPLNH